MKNTRYRVLRTHGRRIAWSHARDAGLKQTRFLLSSTTQLLVYRISPRGLLASKALLIAFLPISFLRPGFATLLPRPVTDQLPFRRVGNGPCTCREGSASPGTRSPRLAKSWGSFLGHFLEAVSWAIAWAPKLFRKGR